MRAHSVGSVLMSAAISVRLNSRPRSDNAWSVCSGGCLELVAKGLVGDQPSDERFDDSVRHGLLHFLEGSQGQVPDRRMAPAENDRKPGKCFVVSSLGLRPAPVAFETGRAHTAPIRTLCA